MADSSCAAQRRPHAFFVWCVCHGITLALSAALLTGAATAQEPPPGRDVGAGPTVPATAGAWRIVWQDEFDGTLHPDWVFDIGRGTNGWGNNELQFYTRRPENVRIENGTLVIEARKEG